MKANFFTSEKISSHMTRIEAPGGVCMYLVEGTEKAVLLDTAFGVGDLKGYVKTLTQKPLEVLISHGHVDHAGGAGQFDTVYLSREDWSLEKRHCSMNQRLQSMQNGPGGMPSGITPADFQPERTAAYLPLEEGMRFDLGGVTVLPIAVPGHTQGMLVFLILEDRAAIFGDACGEHTLLIFEESSSISEYRKSLLHLQSFEQEYDTVLRNHGSYTSPKSLLENNLELCDAILAGTDDAFPLEFFGTRGCAAREKRIPEKPGNIIYDPEKGKLNDENYQKNK